MSSVTMKGITKKYAGGVTAVSDFNLEIEDKEFIILVGPSGCGKSTTLRMIAGLEEITQGELYIDGKLVNDVPPKDRDIAMVFQNYALYPHMTVFENMSFGLRIRKMPKNEIKRRVDEAARILEIEHLLDRKPAALSGGQRQRVALGRAIVRNPKVFLLDEPLSNLDAKLRTAMRSELTKLHKRLETTFIYVTHDQTEAMTMGTRIVVLKEGVIQQVAPPQVLFENPCNLFVATFIGTPQMNTAEGTLIDEGGVTYIIFGTEGDSGKPLAKIALPESKGRKPEVLAYIGKKVIFGIRPNDIYNDPDFIAKHPEGVVDCALDLTELLGAESNIYLKLGDLDFTAVVDARTTTPLNAGDTVRVCFDTSAIHLFDYETEKTITN
ncbi:MAG TPA: sn-glycerol-3-phosphate ABC transporter ATP-binding protein UgpC [Clostridiales bacterium]|nr:sn-glycerol-3-phosphate ABC transporter ATP-binding protein UgpC [Clostridiales bacterium]